MKIAVVRKKYNPYGGAERYLHLLLQEWIKKGHEVHVYAHQWPAAETDGLIFHRVPMMGILS
jgi:UDP-glucose:(heptosyl)LPS alpha-1,3-glucosyltransferase